MFAVLLCSHRHNGERQFSRCVILKGYSTHLMDGEMTNVAVFSNVASSDSITQICREIIVGGDLGNKWVKLGLWKNSIAEGWAVGG